MANELISGIGRLTFQGQTVDPNPFSARPDLTFVRGGADIEIPPLVIGVELQWDMVSPNTTAADRWPYFLLPDGARLTFIAGLIGRHSIYSYVQMDQNPHLYLFRASLFTGRNVASTIRALAPSPRPPSLTGYCSVADVGNYVGQDFDLNSVPSETAVQQFITFGFNRLNGVLESNGYVLPVSIEASPQGFSILASLNSQYAAYRVLFAQGDYEQANNVRDDFRRVLTGIETGSLTFSDIETTAPTLRSGLTTSVSEVDPELGGADVL